MDIYEKIENGDYKQKLIKAFVRECPNEHRISDNSYKFCPICGSEVQLWIEEKEKRHIKKRKEIKAHNLENMQRFKNNVIDYCDLTFNDKKEKAFDMAWERGHSNGLSSVVQELEELAELIN